MAKSFKTAKTIKLFLDECDEYLNELNQDLVELERGDTNPELLQRVSRNVHTLKGSSAMLEYMDISEISHKIEDVLDKVKKIAPEVDKSMVDEIFEKVDKITSLVKSIREGTYEQGQGGEEPPGRPAPPPPPPPPPAPSPAAPVSPATPKEPVEAKVAAPDAKAATPTDSMKPVDTGRTNLFRIFGPPIRGALERCFPVFSDIEGKYVLLTYDSTAPAPEVFKQLQELVVYLYRSLVCMAEPEMNEILMRLMILLDRLNKDEIPRSNAIFEIVFTGAQAVKAIIENYTEPRAGQEAIDIAPLIKKIEDAMKPVKDRRDYVAYDSALEIFARLDVDKNVAASLIPYEKYTIARALIDGYNLLHFEMKFKAEEGEDLINLSDFFKPLMEGGDFFGAMVWQRMEQGKSKEYHYHLFYGTPHSLKEIEKNYPHLAKLENITKSHVGIMIERKEPKPGQAQAPRAAAAPASGTAAAKPEMAAPAPKPAAKAAAQGAKKGTDANVPTVRVDTNKLDELVNFIGELVINHNKMEEEIKFLKQGINRLGDVIENMKLVRKTSDLSSRNITLEDLLEPFNTISEAESPGGRQHSQPVMLSNLQELRTIQDNVVELFDLELEKDQVINTVFTELSKLKVEMDDLYTEFQNDGLNIGRVIVDLQDETMKLRMLPISSVFNKFPRRVRDIAKQLGKKIDFIMEGEETELDKTLIEEIEDPLLHIIRNSLDHGIETRDQRITSGKQETGTICARAFHEGNQVVIEVEDDGRGIDPERIKEKCVEKRLISREEADAMSEKEAINLIFIPGFSTATQVSDLSGRGVGMDVVRNSISKLKGTVDVFSAVGEGTRFKLKLPLTLAIIQSMIVKSHGYKFVIPMDPIESTERLPATEISCVDGKEVFRYQEMIIPVVKMRDVFNIPDDRDPQTTHPVVVVSQGEKKVGVVVDEVIEKQQVVIKSLGEFLGDIKYISGATIFGDGSVALIIDVGGVVNSISYIARKADRKDARMLEASEKNILLVDDSISGRIAQREMLERMGFMVDVASSGMQALAKLGEQAYDMVVTDINMPRMDGYELTLKIRSMESTRRIPIVMVTSDVKKADRNKAYEVGVNDFLAKPFSEEELRTTIEKHLRIY